MKTYYIAQGTVSQYFVITYKGKESEHIYVCITQSLCCILVTNTTL